MKKHENLGFWDYDGYRCGSPGDPVRCRLIQEICKIPGRRVKKVFVLRAVDSSVTVMGPNCNA